MNTHTYDIIIVGGGIAGLYTAYSLLQKNKKYSILLLEKSARCGGRIFTYRKQGMQVEMGAGRISYTHTRVNKLIKELQLDSFKYTIPSKIDNILVTPSNKPKQYKHVRQNETLDIPTLFSLIISKSKRYKKQTLVDMTFQQLVKKVLSADAYSFFMDAYEYKADIQVCNAHDYIRLYKLDFSRSNKFFVLTCGLDTITTKLYKHLRNKITLKNNTTCTDIYYHKQTKVFTVNNKYSSKQIVLALPQAAIDTLGVCKYTSCNKMIKSVKPLPLTRIYAKYPKDNDTKKVWFYNMNKVTTNKKIKYIIPVDQDKGIIMISYTDGKESDFWGSMRRDDKKVKKKLKKELDILFPNIHIPEPTNIIVGYWKEGVHFFKPSCSSSNIAPKILQPFTDRKLYICGEAYSKHQAWIEGALETADKIVTRIHKHS